MKKWLFCLAALAGCGVADTVGPRVDLLAPGEARMGATVDVLGDGFCGAASTAGPDDACEAGLSGFVTFGAAAGVTRLDSRVSSWQRTRIRMVVPTVQTGPMNVVVTVDGRPSNPTDFLVTP